MTTPTDHLLLVDDDTQLTALLREYFEGCGFQVSTAHSATQARRCLNQGHVDLVVLDVMLPGEDGLSLCRDLRAGQGSPIPVIMLTARGEEVDRVVGLEMGADDYVSKPFATRELLARVRSVLRRTRMLPPNLGRPSTIRRHGFEGWSLNTVSRELFDPSGTLVFLTAAEYRLLQVFVEHPQRVLSRDQLLELTQGRSSEAFDRSIDLLVSRLRRRLRDVADKDGRLIKTVRSSGYVFCAQTQILEAAP